MFFSQGEPANGRCKQQCDACCIDDLGAHTAGGGQVISLQLVGNKDIIAVVQDLAFEIRRDAQGRRVGPSAYNIEFIYWFMDNSVPSGSVSTISTSEV